MEYLSVKEVAELKGCSVQYIKKLCKENKLESNQDINSKGKMKYMISVASLPEDLQAKYYKSLKNDVNLMPEIKEDNSLKKPLKTVKKAFEEYSEEEREEIAMWCRILEEWNKSRIKYKKKTEFDTNFIGKCKIEYPNIEISSNILYRKYSAYIENDYDNLIDHRGGWNKNSSSINDKVWNMFASLYLNFQNPKISNCYRTLIAWCKVNHPELVAGIPSERTFRRRVEKELNGAVASFVRDGEKKCLAKYGMYAERDYINIEANDVWIFDNHTLDVITMSPEGKKHRLSITTIQDAKSGIIVGCNPCENPSSQSTLYTMYRAVTSGYGLCRYAYLDNGSEFLTHDIAGRGHRKKANWNKDDSPPTIFELLGIKTINANVENPDAKNIERFFYTFKELFSKSQRGYCGGTVLERHETLNDRLKKGEISTDNEIMELLELFIKSYNASEYGGKERQYKGMSRIDVWNKSINSDSVTFRDVASETDLTLLLSRSTRYQKIKRNGVYIMIYGKKMWFRDKNTSLNIGKEVYVRYDPYNLETVRVYDKESDKYLWTYHNASFTNLPYLSMEAENGKERVKEFVANQNRIRKDIKEMADKYLNSPDALDYIAARINEMQLLANGYKIEKPTKFEPVTAQEVNVDYPEREDITLIDLSGLASELELSRVMNDKLEKARKGA